MPTPTSDTADMTAGSLLEDLGWLRSLARTLARDPVLAEDLVQDTCVIALQQEKRPRRPRAWLTTVLRNLLLAHRRREQARNRREGEGPGQMPDNTLTLLQRAEAQRELVEAVIKLDEPYRSTVLLRYFDGLTPKRIADRDGVPVATVNSRLQRALRRLRSRLDNKLGGRGAWAVAFAPIVAQPVTHSALAGLLLMQTKVKVVLAAAVVACTVPFWWPADAADADTRPLDQQHRAASGGGGGGGGGASRSSGGLRNERTRVVPASNPKTTPVAAERFTISGRVCDCLGAGLPGIRIAPNGDEDAVAESDAGGRFEVVTTGTKARLASSDAEYVTVLAGDWSKESTIEPVVVVAPALALAGLTVEANGAPIAGSDLRLRLPADLESRFPVPLDRAGPERWSTNSDERGAYSLPRLPRIEGAELLVTADAFAPATVPIPQRDDANLQVVLQRFHYEKGELLGRVLDPSGAPASGARVAMGLTSVVTDSDGRFGLNLRRAGWPTAITAAKAGHLPARLELPRNGGKKREDWGDEIVLRLGPTPQSARGRVVDQDRQGIAGAEVWIADPTPLGIAAIMPLQVEYLIAGGIVPAQIASMKVPFADDPTHDGNYMDQASVMRPTAGWFYVTTDESGAFELPGLLDRTYTLKALDPSTGLFGDAAAVTGGSYHEITIARDSVWAEVRGRVVSLTGEPMGGVSVEQYVVAQAVLARVPGGHFEGMALRPGRSTTTKEDGTFVLRDVGRRSCYFGLSGDKIVPSQVAAEAITDPKNCTMTVEARCHVEVVLANPDEADRIRCLDNNGEELDLAILRRNSNQFLTDLPLHDGRSGLFVVSQRAATIVLLRDGMPGRRIPIAPDPQRKTTVQ